MNTIFDYTIMIGIGMCIVGLFYMLYMCLRIFYEAVKEREPVFVVIGLLSSGFLIILLSTILDALVKSIH